MHAHLLPPGAKLTHAARLLMALATVAGSPLLRAMAGYSAPIQAVPKITAHPAGISAYAGQPLSLSVTATAWPEPVVSMAQGRIEHPRGHVRRADPGPG